MKKSPKANETEYLSIYGQTKKIRRESRSDKEIRRGLEMKMKKGTDLEIYDFNGAKEVARVWIEE